MPNNTDMPILHSKDLFSEDGPIARHLQEYEVRPQQLRMAEAVDEAVAARRHLIVEAGTGVGKSLAYLVPMINWSVRENTRAVISTYTKALQNQLFVKDLPFLSRALDVEFRYAICMGSNNYVCLRKAERNSARDPLETKKRKDQVEKIFKWLSNTGTGLVTDMDLVPEGSVWDRFSRESDLCLGKKCPQKGRCFYMQARRVQAEAHILVTNHALLLTDMMSEVRILPEFHSLVLDEAHMLEDVATGHFGKEISNSGLARLIENISSVVSSKNIVWTDRTAVKQKVRGVEDRIMELHASSAGFFSEAEKILGKNESTTQFDCGNFSYKESSKAMMELSFSLAELNRVLKDPDGREATHAYAERCGKLSEAFEFIFEHKEGYVYWAEVAPGRRDIVYSFHAAPIDVSEQMKTYLFDRVSPVVLTSATLATPEKDRGRDKAAGPFRFIKERLALEDCSELLLDSPFDYKNNVLVYLPHMKGDPGKDPGTFRRQVRDNILEIFDVMGGRIFALFTSYAMLNAVAREIGRMREDINMLKQGDLPRYVLLDVFKRSPDSVLLGTTTFWQGVDVPGDSLECVIITKLPFSVPSDPVNAARIRSVREKGKNPFLEYQLPQAVIMFKQGFGRLIRGRSDRGVAAVLDPRVRTRSYGREFINALPPCRQTDDIREVEAFFAENRGIR